MSKATLSDISKALGFDKKDKKTSNSYYGTVEQVVPVAEGKFRYLVRIDGNNKAVECARLVGAKKDDRVLVTVLENGHAVVTNRIDGDLDAKDAADLALEAKELAEDATDWIDDHDEEIAGFATSITNLNQDVVNLQDQIDGNITTWFYAYEPTLSNYPYTDWYQPSADPPIDTRNNHLGDLFYNTLTGYAYRFMENGAEPPVYSWSKITDSDVTEALRLASNAQDTADSKRRVFITTPYIPSVAEDGYDVGDIWFEGDSGDILTCITPKTSSGLYNYDDWAKLNSYTDDTVAEEAYIKANNSIASDTLHYLATSYQSGVSTEDSPSTYGTWSTTIQTVTATNKYLWTYHTYTLQNGNTSTSSPIITGVYGDKGDTGATGPTGPTGPQGSPGVSTKYYGTRTWTEATWEAYSQVGYTDGWTQTVSGGVAVNVGDILEILVTRTERNNEVWVLRLEATTTTPASQNATATVISATQQTGDSGSDGISVISIQPQYAVNNSTFTPPAEDSSDWSTSLNWYSGGKVWTREEVTYSPGAPSPNPKHTTPIYDDALTTAAQNTEDTQQHFWFKSTGSSTSVFPSGAWITNYEESKYTDSTQTSYYRKGGALLARSDEIRMYQGQTPVLKILNNGLHTFKLSSDNKNGQRLASYLSDGLYLYDGVSSTTDDADLTATFKANEATFGGNQAILKYSNRSMGDGYIDSYRVVLAKKNNTISKRNDATLSSAQIGETFSDLLDTNVAFFNAYHYQETATSGKYAQAMMWANSGNSLTTLSITGGDINNADLAGKVTGISDGLYASGKNLELDFNGFRAVAYNGEGSLSTNVGDSYIVDYDNNNKKIYLDTLTGWQFLRVYRKTITLEDNLVISANNFIEKTYTLTSSQTSDIDWIHGITGYNIDNGSSSGQGRVWCSLYELRVSDFSNGKITVGIKNHWSSQAKIKISVHLLYGNWEYLLS